MQQQLLLLGVLCLIPEALPSPSQAQLRQQPASPSPSSFSSTTNINSWRGTQLGYPGPIAFSSDGPGGSTGTNALDYGSATLIPAGLPGSFSNRVVVGLPGQDAQTYSAGPFPGPRLLYRLLIDTAATWSTCLLTGDLYAPLAHSAVRNGSRLVVFGGVEFPANTTLSNSAVVPASSGLFLVDPVACTSQRLVSPTPTAAQPSARFGHAAMLWTAQQRMVVVGGCSSFTPTCLQACVAGTLPAALEVWTLDLLTLEWALIEPAKDSPQPASRLFLAASIRDADETLHLFLGSNAVVAMAGPGEPVCQQTGGNLQSAWRLNLSASAERVWTALPDAPFTSPSVLFPTFSIEGTCFATLGPTTYGFGGGRWFVFELHGQSQPLDMTVHATGMRYVSLGDDVLLLLGSIQPASSILASLFNSNQSLLWTQVFGVQDPFAAAECLLGGAGPELASASTSPTTAANTSAVMYTRWSHIPPFHGITAAADYRYIYRVFTPSAVLYACVISIGLKIDLNWPTWILESSKYAWSPAPAQSPIPLVEFGTFISLNNSECVLLIGGAELLSGETTNSISTFCYPPSSSNVEVPLGNGHALSLPTDWQTQLPTPDPALGWPGMQQALGAQLGAVVVVVGYSNYASSDPLPATWCLHLANMSWTSLALDQQPPAIVGAAAAAVVLEGMPTMLVYGGLVGDGVEGQISGDVWLYAIGLAGWRLKQTQAASAALTSQLVSLPVELQQAGRPQNRTFGCLAKIGEIMLLLAFGTVPDALGLNGNPAKSHDPPAYAWLLDLETWQWLPLPGTAFDASSQYYASAMLGTYPVQCHAQPGTLASGNGGLLKTVHALGVITTNNNFMTLQLGCPPGTYSPAFPDVPCRLCEKGTFSGAGASNCTQCPDRLTTYTAGSASISECSVCRTGVCNGHGTCYVQRDQEGVLSSVCHCYVAYSGGTCDERWLLYTSLGVIGAIITAYVSYRLVKLRMARMRTYTELQEQLLDKANTELQELHRVFEIAAEDIQLVRRVDGGVGAFGEVWVGSLFGADVAVKILLESALAMSPEAADDFEREVAALKTLRHRNIVLFYGAGVFAHADGDRPFLVTEFMARGSLRAMLMKRVEIELSWERRLGFVRETADGMAFLHGHSRIHRDLKTANLLVNTNWTVKVADFGTARLLDRLEESQDQGGGRPRRRRRQRRRDRQSDRDSSTVHFDEPYAVSGADWDSLRDRQLTKNVGTPIYTAPEIVRGETNYTAAVDIYSFGIVMWEVARRETPFAHIKGPLWKVTSYVLDGGRPQASASAAAPAELPAEYAGLMERCWSEDAATRPSFAAIVEEMAGWPATTIG